MLPAITVRYSIKTRPLSPRLLHSIYRGYCYRRLHDANSKLSELVDPHGFSYTVLANTLIYTDVEKSEFTVKFDNLVVKEKYEFFMLTFVKNYCKITAD